MLYLYYVITAFVDDNKLILVIISQRIKIIVQFICKKISFYFICSYVHWLQFSPSVYPTVSFSPFVIALAVDVCCE